MTAQVVVDDDGDDLDLEFGALMDALDDVLGPMRAVAAQLPGEDGAHSLFKCLEIDIERAPELMFENGAEAFLRDVQLIGFIIGHEVIRPSGGLTAGMLEELAGVAARASDKLTAYLFPVPGEVVDLAGWKAARKG